MIDVGNWSKRYTVNVKNKTSGRIKPEDFIIWGE
jgi:hypothetical protein